MTLQSGKLPSSSLSNLTSWHQEKQGELTLLGVRTRLQAGDMGDWGGKGGTGGGEAHWVLQPNKWLLVISALRDDIGSFVTGEKNTQNNMKWRENYQLVP